MREIHEFEIKNMIRIAEEAKSRAYAPYSKFRVGACLKGMSGAYYMGCNIENAAYSPTVCAERNALFRAICDGERSFEALAIAWDGENYAVPCGVCRQVLVEFCDPGLPVICAGSDGSYKLISLGALLPAAFTQGDLG